MQTITDRLGISSKGNWIFLMVNLSDLSVKITQIKTSKNPDLFILKLNTHKNKHQNKWMVLLRIGPFHDKRLANKLTCFWNKNSRGLHSRVFKGLQITKKCQSFNIIVKAFFSPMTKCQMTNFFHKEKLWLTDEDYIRNNEKNESLDGMVFMSAQDNLFPKCVCENG